MAWRARRKGRGRGGDDVVLDREKSPAENVKEVLTNICRRSGGISEDKKVCYLGALCSLLQEVGNVFSSGPGCLRLGEVLLCLRLPLTQHNTHLRAAVLRTLRHLLATPGDCHSFLAAQLHLLLSRSLDSEVENKGERVQAAKLCRKLLLLQPSSFPSCVTHSLLAIIQSGGRQDRRDHLWQAALALLCELSCLAPHLFLSVTPCPRILAQALLDCFQLPRVQEAIIGSLLRIYNYPSFRDTANLSLGHVVAPLTELHYVHTGLSKEEESRVSCASQAFLSLLRSWTGLIHLSSPSLATRPLRSLLETLHLPHYQTRRLILGIIYQSLCLKAPEWTDEVEVAIRTADPNSPSDNSWKLAEGFVAAEGRDLLPPLSRSRPNLKENHMSLLLSTYIEAGIVNALTEVIVTGDTDISLSACVLLGQFLHLASKLLPHEINATVHCLPTLTGYLSGCDPDSNLKATRASTAISSLHKLHCLKRKGIRPRSLFLEQVLSNSGWISGEGGDNFLGDRLKLPRDGYGPGSWPEGQVGPDSRGSESEASLSLSTVKETGVTVARDPQSWKWELILSLIRWPSDSLRRLDDSNHRMFLKKLTSFYLPSSNMFSRLELESAGTRLRARVACHLIDFLLSCLPISVQGKDTDCEALVRLDSLIQDIGAKLEEVLKSSSPHDCFFSPTRLSNSACQLYFLFLGRLSRTEAGRGCLDRHNILPLLTDLLGVTQQAYLKLVVTSLDYRTDEWGARTHVLTRALQGKSEAGRVYSTKWMGVLARLGAPSIAVYGVELLVRQLRDPSLEVASTALNILDEVCDDKMFLESLVSNSNLLLSGEGAEALSVLGDRGKLLLVKCVSSTSGLNHLLANQWLSTELEIWKTSMNLRYVLLVENLLSDGLSLHQRSEGGYGTYGRRTGEGEGSSHRSVRDVFLPPHLYGQLAQTKAGLELLTRQPAFWEMVSTVQEVARNGPGSGLSECEETWLSVKAALWGVSSACTGARACLLLEQRGVIASLVTIAETCTVLTLKGTAFYCLGLVATTRPGATALGTRAWATVRHTRAEMWPIARDWLEASDPQFPASPHHVQELQQAYTRESHDSESVEDRQKDEVRSQLLSPSPGSKSSAKLSNRLSNWFRSSVDSGRGTDPLLVNTNGHSNTTASGSKGRRFSEGSKGFSAGLARAMRQSLRLKVRTRTVSTGDKDDCTPKSSLDTSLTVESPADEAHEAKYSKRKLSFGGAGPPSLGGDEQPDSMSVSLELASAPSPGETLPGEIFPLQDIVEEPERGSTFRGGHQNVKPSSDTQGLTRPSQSSSSSGFSSGSSLATKMQQQQSQKQAQLSPIPSESQDQVVGGSHSVSQAIKIDTGLEAREIEPAHASAGFVGLLGAIKTGTSVSSVSSVGSYTLQEYSSYGKTGGGSTTSRRRPQLSESEEQPGGRQETQPGRNTFPIRGRSKRQADLHGVGSSEIGPPSCLRSASVPPIQPVGSLGNPEGNPEPQYWGLAFPLNHSVLYPAKHCPPPGQAGVCGVSPGIVSSLLSAAIPWSHNSSVCLVCSHLEVDISTPGAAARQRTSSLGQLSLLTGTEQSGSAHSSSSLPGSPRRLSLLLQQGNSSGSPTGVKEAVQEALDLISLMNNAVKAKKAEESLVKFQRKWPSLFTDLCFYSEVLHILGTHYFRLPARRFIHELFTELDFSKMDQDIYTTLQEKLPKQ